MQEDRHELFLRTCVELARQTMSAGNPPFASILVVDGEAILKAANTTKVDSNFLHHGEMNLLWRASQSLDAQKLSRAILYASNEPCPMCAGAIYWSGIRSLVYGCSRDALTKVRQFGLNVPCREILNRGTDNFSVIGPLLEEDILPLYSDYYGKATP